MRKLSFCLFLVLTLLTNVHAQKTELAPWFTLEPEGAGFTVLLPAAATERIDKKESYTLHSFIVTVGRATYVASYSDYKPVKLDLKTSLIVNRDKFNKTLEATLTSSREITLSGHTGLEFISETPAHNIKSQLFLIENRMFHLATLVYKDVDETRNVDRFFQSFKFTPK